MENVVITVTVTFNSYTNLEKLVGAIFHQKYSVDKMVIVDNNSSEECKEKIKYLEKTYPSIEVLWLPQNTGGAGGFHEGIKYAYEKYKPDWIWIMDDDAYPEPNCLERLLLNSSSLDNIGFLAPIIWGIDKKDYQYYHFLKLKRGRYSTVFQKTFTSFDMINPIEEIDADAFVGPLLSRNAIEKIGYPRKEYFLEGDDTDYTFRVTRDFKGYLIKNAVINHKDLIKNPNKIDLKTYWKNYYLYRNRILFAKYNLKNLNKIINCFKTILDALKLSITVLYRDKYRNYRFFVLRIIWSGIADGLLNKYGCQLTPADYKDALSKYNKSHCL